MPSLFAHTGEHMKCTFSIPSLITSLDAVA